jgi:hypothetical protein
MTEKDRSRPAYVSYVEVNGGNLTHDRIGMLGFNHVIESDAKLYGHLRTRVLSPKVFLLFVV